ncbi:MAG: efflux RND transporter periplasmic adaptor subunit [Bacteroidaceae bacterium]|nr:efflux RND transporter periplasmic adaptor subunit [Bacteroidaceae bacterium]
MKKETLFLATVSTLMFVGCTSNTEDKTISPTRVKTEIVSGNSDLNVSSYVGEIEAEESTSVSFTGMGTLLKMCIEEGQVVQKGQLIAQMDPVQCQNTLANAEAQMKQASDVYTRMKALHDSQSISDMKWVEVESQVEQAKATLEMAQKALKDCNLYAPVNGVIGEKRMSAGETALPGVTVCTILKIDDVKIKVNIPEKEITNIASNSASTIRIGAIEKTLNGGLIEKGVQADAITRSYTIRINVENKDKDLLPGMVADVNIKNSLSDSDSTKTSLTVPITAVQRSADGKMYVWVAKDGKAKRAEVNIGKTRGNRIAIYGNVKIGDRVITEGYQKLSESSAITEI